MQVPQQTRERSAARPLLPEKVGLGIPDFDWIGLAVGLAYWLSEGGQVAAWLGRPAARDWLVGFVAGWLGD